MTWLRMLKYLLLDKEMYKLIRDLARGEEEEYDPSLDVSLYGFRKDLAGYSAETLANIKRLAIKTLVAQQANAEMQHLIKVGKEKAKTANETHFELENLVYELDTVGAEANFYSQQFDLSFFREPLKKDVGVGVRE